MKLNLNNSFINLFDSINKLPETETIEINNEKIDSVLEKSKTEDNNSKKRENFNIDLKTFILNQYNTI